MPHNKHLIVSYSVSKAIEKKLAKAKASAAKAREKAEASEAIASISFEEAKNTSRKYFSDRLTGILGALEVGAFTTEALRRIGITN